MQPQPYPPQPAPQYPPQTYGTPPQSQAYPPMPPAPQHNHNAPPAAPAIPQIITPTVAAEPGPSPSEMSGRTVAFMPLRMTQSPKLGGAPGEMVPSVIADVYVLGTGTFDYGAAPQANPPRPVPTHRVQLPALFRGQIFSGVNIVRALEAHVGSGGAVCGIMVRSDVGQRPWNLQASDRANNEAGAFFAGLASRQVQLGQPQPLQAAAPAAPQAPSYAPQPQQNQPAPGYYGNVAPQVPAPAQAPQGYGAYPQAPAEPQQHNHVQPTVPPAPTMPPAGLPVPPNFDPNLWVTLTAEQQQFVLSQQGAAPQAPPNPY